MHVQFIPMIEVRPSRERHKTLFCDDHHILSGEVMRNSIFVTAITFLAKRRTVTFSHRNGAKK